MTLQPWLYRALERRSEILAVHPAYFELTGGIERWLYRLARKAVPDNADVPAITFPVQMLYEHSGVTRLAEKIHRQAAQNRAGGPAAGIRHRRQSGPR